MNKQVLSLVLALLLAAFFIGCTQKAHRSEITLPAQEKTPVTEETITEPAEEPETPKYLNLAETLAKQEEIAGGALDHLPREA